MVESPKLVASRILASSSSWRWSSFTNCSRGDDIWYSLRCGTGHICLKVVEDLKYTYFSKASESVNRLPSIAKEHQDDSPEHSVELCRVEFETCRPHEALLCKRAPYLAWELDAQADYFQGCLIEHALQRCVTRFSNIQRSRHQRG